MLNWPVLGGSERQALLLAKQLAAVEGAEVEVQALTAEEGRAVGLFRDAGIPWHGGRARWGSGGARTFATLARVAGRLRHARPDVLLPYCELPNVVCGLLWRFTGAATCVWNQRDVLPFTLGDGLVRRAVRNTPVLVSNSVHAAGYLERVSGVAADDVRVVRNGVALEPARASRSEWRGRLGLGEADFVVAALAHITAEKDHATLLRAWRVAESRIEDGGTSGALVLAGRTEGRQGSLEALVRELGVDASVRFAGDVDDVAGLLGAADAGALSSPAEGCPNALLECMAAGLPVVGTDVAGIREAVGANGVAFLAPPGDAEALGAALARLALDPGLRDGLGLRNGERVCSLFGIERMLEESVSVLVQALAASAQARRPAAVH